MTSWQPRPGDQVVVFPDSARQAIGRVVEDFGDGPTYGVDIGNGETIMARRWAVHTDDGGLVFVDTGDLARVLTD